MKIKFVILHIMALLFALLFIACASVGQHLPITSGEEIIGTIQTTFVARDSWFSKNNERMNTQAYIKLLEAAVIKFSGDIDIRDIVWVTGRTMGSGNIEVSATAKVIRSNSNEKQTIIQ
jgi:hypothetical protein